MKKLYVLVIVHFLVSGAFCQVGFPNMQDTLVKTIFENESPNYGQYNDHRLDSNREYRHVKDGFVMQGGQLKLVRNGSLFLLNSPVTLKNGAIVMTDGIIKMGNGSTPLLRTEDFIDMDGNIRPLHSQINNFSF